MKSWIFLGIAILGEVVATSALKSTEGFTRLLPSAVVLVGYGIAFYCFALALKDIPVGIAYAVWAGLGIVLVAGIAWALYGQKLDAWALVGIGMILGGVLVLNLLSKSSAH
jgi:multidrug transporter EmrE-like cation transporter